MTGRSRRTAMVTACIVVAAFSVVVVPHASAENAPRESRNQSIVIDRDTAFTAANGVRSGTGSARDPYVISDWKVFSIKISDTDKHVVIANNEVEFLVLNWNGDRVTVRNNDVGDLRVNENVRRTGGPTSGSITNNRFGVVGQLRHFDGIFARNIVGAPGDGGMAIPFFSDRRAVNFDGFNGARFFNNTLYGYLEVRLHGHHHGSSYDDASHDHSTPDENAGHEGHDMDSMVDHTNRFHEVWVHHNKIYSSGRYGLIYTDSNHAGNDRTANSEQNPELNKPHTHHTKVHLTDNTLVGSGLYVDIFNADDDRHTQTERGLMEIARNEITVNYGDDRFPFESRDGITVREAKDVALRILDNTVAYDAVGDPLALDDQWESASGIALRSLDDADVWIVRNFVQAMFFGVSASDMSSSVHWRVFDLETNGVQEEVRYDESVANEPERDH